MIIYRIRRAQLCFFILFLSVSYHVQAQEGHNLYIGTNYLVNIEIKERDESSACNPNNPATGLCPVLHYNVVRVPLLDLGYFYLKNLKSYPAYGWHAGINFKSYFYTQRMIIDYNYYEFYRLNGFYPDTGLKRTVVFPVYVHSGLNYSNEKIYILAGLSCEVYTRRMQKFNRDYGVFRATINSYFSSLDAYVRFGYKFSKILSAYFSFQTPTRNFDYTRDCHLSLGVNYTFKKAYK